MKTSKEEITYSELARRVGNIYMFNKAPEIDPEMLYEGIVNGTLWTDDEDEENAETKEIFQYFLINESGADYLKRVSDELIFYSEILDEYVWGITHFGTSWDGVTVEIEA